MKQGSSDYLNQLTPDQLEKFHQLSPKHQDAFFSIMKGKDKCKKKEYQSVLSISLDDIWGQDVDQLLSRGVFEFVAELETYSIVNDYYFISIVDEYFDRGRRRNFTGEWPPNKDDLILNTLSYNSHLEYGTGDSMDDLRLVISRLDNVEFGEGGLYASDLFESLSEAVEAKEIYFDHRELIEIFAISYYCEWTLDEIDGKVERVLVKNLYEYINPRHITKNLESAVHNLVETQKRFTHPQIFYGHFIRKTDAYKLDILPKYMRIPLGRLNVLREFDKDNNLDYKHIEEDEYIAEHLFISRQSLSVEINPDKTVGIGVYLDKETEFCRLIWEKDPISQEYWRFAIFKDGNPYLPFSTHLKIPVRKNNFFRKILRKMDSLQQDRIIQRCQTMIQKIVSLSYFVAYDFSVLNLFAKFLEDYLENNSNAEILLELLESIDKYFDLPETQRMNFSSLTKFFRNFLIDLCVFFLSE